MEVVFFLMDKAFFVYRVSSVTTCEQLRVNVSRLDMLILV